MRTIKTYEDFVNEEINLKKAITTGALAAGMVLSNPSKGQITTTKINKKPPIEVEVPKYDSTENFTSDLRKLIGQDFYLKNRKDNIFAKSVYKFYEYNKNGILKKVVDIDNLEGKYLKLLDITSVGNQFAEDLYYDHVLKFELKGTNRTIYYDYSSFSKGDTDEYKNKTRKDFEEYFPFIIVGFFEKQKKLLIGSTLTEAGGYQLTSKDGRPLSYVEYLNGIPVDINTGNYLAVGHKIWTCTDITINESNNKMSLVFKNENNYIMISFDSFFGDISNPRRNNKTKNEYDLKNKSSSDRSSSDRSGVCLSGNARIKMSNGDYKMISQIKEGDFLSTGIVKKLHITEVNDVIDLVDMSNFFITPGHLILSDNFWIRPDSINPVIQKYIDFVYNIELVDGDSFDSDGFICISLTKIYLEGKKYRVFAENYL